MRDIEEMNCNDRLGVVFEYDHEEEYGVVRFLCSQPEEECEKLESLTPEEKKQLEEYEKHIEENMDGFLCLGGFLSKINALRLYRGTHATFEAYVRDRWDFSRSHAYRLINASKTAENLKMSPIGDKIKLGESQLREVSGLSPEEQVEVVKQAQAATNTQNPTAEAIAEARKAVKPRTGSVRPLNSNKNSSTPTKATSASDPATKAPVVVESKNKQAVSQIKAYLESVKKMMDDGEVDKLKVKLAVDQALKLLGNIDATEPKENHN